MKKKYKILLSAVLALWLHQHAHAQTELISLTPSNSTALTRQLYLTAVRIEVSGPKGEGTGTAFLLDNDVDRSTSNQVARTFLVTNRHLVEGYEKGKITFIPAKDGKPLLGRTVSAFVTNWQTKWFCHPSTNIDVAVLPLIPGLDYLVYDPDLSSNAMNWANLAWARSGSVSTNETSYLRGMEEVIFLGYPVDFYDTAHSLPVSRHGYTASPIPIDFQGEPVFAIDAAVFPGSSGSPVFLYDPCGYETSGGSTLGSRMLLAGIIAKCNYIDTTGKFMLKEVPNTWEGTYTNRQPFNVGIAFRAETIFQTIDAYLALKQGAAKKTPPK